MKKFLLALIFLCPLQLAQAKTLKVVATTPDLADLARAVGGDKIKVEALASPFQDPHFVDAKPSLIVKLMSADLFIETGMELEVGWAPLLLQSSGNRKIQPGAKGFLDASAAISPLEVPANPSRAQGDVHPSGNPHYLLDPENGKLVARLILRKLTELSPEDQAYFENNLNTFETQADQKIALWKQELAPYKNAKFVSHHRIYIYFAERFELIPLGEMEPKPGIPPTASHTAELIAIMKKNNVKLILMEPWFEKRTAQTIAAQTGAKIITQSIFPGSAGNTKNYLEAIGYNVESIANALK